MERADTGRSFPSLDTSTNTHTRTRILRALGGVKKEYIQIDVTKKGVYNSICHTQHGIGVQCDCMCAAFCVHYFPVRRDALRSSR